MENPFTFNMASLLVVPGILLGYTAHELGHVLTAYFLGDYTQVENRKISLNPLIHISWLGSLAFILLGIGWPKIMRVNPDKLHHRHRDMFLVAMAGPLASLTLSLVGGLITLTMAATLVYLSGTTTDRVLSLFIPEAFPQTFNAQTALMAFTGYIASTSLILTVMSLLPFPGQDGFIALVSLLAFLRERNGGSSAKVQTSSRTGSIITAQQKRRDNAAEIHFKIGTEYHATEKYDDAIARYRQAINNDQNFGAAYINLGLAYLAKNEQHQAIHAFRGATQYADDQRSQAEAWRQLELLSETTLVGLDQTPPPTEEVDLTPWTDTKPQPDWWGFAFGGGLLLITGLVLYSYLITQLVKMLQA